MWPAATVAGLSVGLSTSSFTPSARAALLSTRRCTPICASVPPSYESLGVRSLRIEEQKEFAGRPFPLVLTPTDSASLTQWGAEHRDDLLHIVRENEAVLLRGCECCALEPPMLTSPPLIWRCLRRSR